MNKENIYNKIREHHKAASIASILVGLTVIIALPDGINLLDLSSKKSKSAVINHDRAFLNLIDWEYSTHIQETDGMISFDYMYGLPDMLILDPGKHTLDVSCNWHIYNTRWIDAESRIKIDLDAGTVYKLISKRVEIPSARDTCVVELMKINSSSELNASDIQNQYLQKYGFELISR